MATPTPEVFALPMTEMKKRIVGTEEAFRAMGVSMLEACGSFAVMNQQFGRLSRFNNNRRFTWVDLSPLVVRSRNKREGRYAGKHNGRHQRAKS